MALAADDVLLDDLLARLTQVSGAADLLLGVSVYREPVDMNAVLFQAGQHDPAAEDRPGRRITEILVAAGMSPEKNLDLASMPHHLRVLIEPYLAELNRRPTPPYQRPPATKGQIAACRSVGLLTITGTVQDQRFFVHRWTAAELADRAAGDSAPQLAHAHRQAAAYWKWRTLVWPQSKTIDVHDLLEARYHFLEAGDRGNADEVTEAICKQLHIWGAWDQESALIYDTLAYLPAESAQRCKWHIQLGGLAHRRGDHDEAADQYERSLAISKRFDDQLGMAVTYHQLGVLAHGQGDYDAADRNYQRSLDILKQLGDQARMAMSYEQRGRLAQDRGDWSEAARYYQSSLDISERLGERETMASSHEQLGKLAYLRGDWSEAGRRYDRSLSIRERLGDQIGIAGSCHMLGLLAHDQGDYEEAARQYERSLDIKERLGDQAGMASSYHQLGMLAYDQDDYEEAARQYERSLDIKERLGNQAGMALTYHQLGILAHTQGKYEEAASRYQRSLNIRERLGDRAGIAGSYHQLGVLAQDRGDYEEADLQYRRSLKITEQLGNSVGMATTYSQLGSLESERANPASAIAWHVKALTIKLRLKLPSARRDLRFLTAHRSELGPETFSILLHQAADNTNLAQVIMSLLDRLAADNDTA